MIVLKVFKGLIEFLKSWKYIIFINRQIKGLNIIGIEQKGNDKYVSNVVCFNI